MTKKEFMELKKATKNLRTHSRVKYILACFVCGALMGVAYNCGKGEGTANAVDYITDGLDPDSIRNF